MRKKGVEFAAGVAIFLSFIIFVFGFLYLKNITLNAGTHDIFIRFKDITGLEKHDKVSVSGITIGKVIDFKLDRLDVLVEVQLNPEVSLPKDSQAELKSLGMVGEKFIDIIPGTAPALLEDGDIIAGKTASDLSEITGTVDGLLQQAEELLIRVKDAFENVFDSTTQRDVKESLQHIRNISSTLDKNSAHLEKTLVNLDELSTTLNQILTERKNKVETSIDNLYAASNKLDGLTNKVDKSLTSVQNLLDKIENQEGAVGKVIMSDSLYNDFRHLTNELETLVQDLKKRPQKYLNLGFIKVF